MFLLPLILAGIVLAQENPRTTHTVTVLDDNPDQRTLNPMSSMGLDETFTILTLKPSGTDEHSQTRWVETTGQSADTTVTSQFSFEGTSSTFTPSGTATHSISWQHGHHMEVVTVTGPDGKPSEVTRADLLSTHVTVSATTKPDGRTVLVPVDQTDTTTITERLTKDTDTATITATFSRHQSDDIETATVTTLLKGPAKTHLPHKEGAIIHLASQSKCAPNPFRKSAYKACQAANCMIAFQKPINYSTVHAYTVFSHLANITYSTSIETAHWGRSDKKKTYTGSLGLKCTDERTCHDVCLLEGRTHFKTLLVFAIIIPLLIFAALLFCCCVPIVWFHKRARNGRAYGSNKEKALTEGSGTSAGNSIARISNDPVGSTAEEVVAGGAAGAAGSRAAGGGGNETTTTSDGRTVTTAPGDSTATITDGHGGGAGTMRRAAEEGRAGQRVRFGDNPAPAAGNAGETVTTTTTQVDGAAELRTGSEVFDVGSMRGRKRSRADEAV